MYGLEDKLLSIGYSFLMLLCAVLVRARAGTFLIPAGIFALTWFAATFFPLLLLFIVPVNSLAILYIAAAVFVVTLSGVPFPWKSARLRNLEKSLPAASLDSRFLMNSLYFSAAMSVVFSAWSIVVNGWTIQTSLIGLIKSSGEFAAQRGSADGVEYGLVGTLGVFFTHLCAVLGGLRSQGPRRGWFFFVALSPSLFAMIIQSTKLVFLVGLSFYLAASLVAKIFANQMKLPNMTLAPKYIVGGIAIAALVLVSFASRDGIYELEFAAMLEPMGFMLSSYILGQIYAFADFFSYTVGMPSDSFFLDDYNSWGAYSFASIYDMLGAGKEFPPGMYEETGSYFGVFQTNIFTFFRGLIYDFGVLGSLLFLFCFGLIAHSVTYHVFTSKRAWFFCAVLIGLIVFILMSYLYSVFVARYVFLNAVVVWILLRVNQLLNLRRASTRMPEVAR